MEFKKVNIPKHLNKSEKIQYRLKSKQEQYTKHALSKMKHHFAIADCDKAHTATQNAPMLQWKSFSPKESKAIQNVQI